MGLLNDIYDATDAKANEKATQKQIDQAKQEAADQQAKQDQDKKKDNFSLL